jgi:malate synthase
VSGAFVDAWLFLHHNAKSILARGLPVAFYLPKLECVQEADLWHTFLYEAEKALGLEPGTVKVYQLVEIINATYQVEEMMYAFSRPIRDARAGKTVNASRYVGPNVGRWDYTASMYRATRADLSAIPPDTNRVTMDGAVFLATYEQYVSDMARRRGAVPWGGMSANILLRAAVRPADFDKIAGTDDAPALAEALQAAGYLDAKGNVTEKFQGGADALRDLPARWEPQREQIVRVLEAFVARAYNNKVALERATDDKTRESGLRPAKDGGRRCFYGAWVATPDMVAVIQPVFEKAAEKGLLKALDTPAERTDWYSPELAARLREFPDGPVTEAGMREDITIALQYMTSYLQGSAAAAVTSPQLKVQLMEDLATAEIRRAALWKRLHAGAVLAGDGPLAGTRLTEEIFLGLLGDEAGKLKGKSLGTATEILKKATTAAGMIPWISAPLNVVLDEENPEVIAASLQAYFDTYAAGGKRLTRVAGSEGR